MWVPCREQQQQDVDGGWDEGDECEEEGRCTPVVLYGGGHGGLFTVRNNRMSNIRTFVCALRVNYYRLLCSLPPTISGTSSVSVPMHQP